MLAEVLVSFIVQQLHLQAHAQPAGVWAELYVEVCAGLWAAM